MHTFILVWGSLNFYIFSTLWDLFQLEFGMGY